MSRIVVPLSLAPKTRILPKTFVAQVLVHMFFVGLPIAPIIGHFTQ